jgi:hypothetical protein
MSRTNRIAFLAALALVIAATGTVMATRAPAADERRGELAASHAAEPLTEEAEEAPDAEAIARVRQRLADAEITATDAEIADLAGRYGLGGAVRLFAWSKETGMSVADVARLRDGDGEGAEPVGWGRIARDLGVRPGIGSIMGNGGGNGGPPGHARNGNGNGNGNGAADD